MNGKKVLFWLIAWMIGSSFIWNALGETTARKATLSEIRGDVQVRIAEGEWEPAREGMVLNEKDEVRTGEGAFVEVLVDDGGSTGQVELGENGRLQVDTIRHDPDSGDKVTYLNLALGKVLVHAEKLEGDSKFEVRTPNASAGVRGTVFEVSVDEA